MNQSEYRQRFIANLGVGYIGALSATADGRLCTIADTLQRLLLLALILASLIVARAEPAAEGTATVPRSEPAPCPKLSGAEELAKASCGFFVVPEDRGQPNGR